MMMSSTENTKRELLKCDEIETSFLESQLYIQTIGCSLDGLDFTYIMYLWKYF